MSATAPDQSSRPPVEPAAGRPPPLQIGALRIAPPVVLAPMSALSNLPMRTLCEEAGCGLTITEFLAAPALIRGVPTELAKLRPGPGGRPFGAQIFGRDPEQVSRAAAVAVEAGAHLVDINMGCPAKKVTKGVAGCALMREPALAVEIARAAHGALAGRVPLTVKMRAGWDDAQKNAPDLACRLVEVGVAAITVHGRTRQQGFHGVVDLEIIRQVRRSLPPAVPVIGNGDVVDVASLQRMFEATGCDAVMIGRGALGNVWLFAAARAWWMGLPPPPPPVVRDRLRMYRRHLDLYLTVSSDEAQAVVEMRKFATWYLRGFWGAAQLRKRLYTLTDVQSVLGLLVEAEAAYS
jgi:nifR3 family TIM-barrel protein